MTLDRVALAHRLVDERRRSAGSNAVAQRLLQRALDAVVVDDPPDRGEDVAALAAHRPVLGQVVQLHAARARSTARPPARCGRRAGAARFGPVVARQRLLQLGELRRPRARRSGSRRRAPCPASASPAARRAPATGCCCEDSIRIRASACASALSGRWTAIWSPSKSALNAWQTSGWTWIALPSTSTGSNAWMPRRWSVGARLRSTGCSWMTSSSTSQTSRDHRVDHLLGRLDVLRAPCARRAGP